MRTMTSNRTSTGTIEAIPVEGRQGRWFRPDAATNRTEVTAPEAAAQVLMPELAGLDREACVAAYLDTKHRLLATELISLGSIDHTFMSPRDVYRGALLANASAVVLAHNHPSGDAEPSRDDELLTWGLRTPTGPQVPSAGVLAPRNPATEHPRVAPALPGRTGARPRWALTS